MMFVFFFFSSRRRHTRFDCDWSSDVCSSDLQSLRQLQIRGAGISGPYQLASDVLPGTEYLRIETRDLQNPERAVATQALIRFVDYQIDYVGGVVLLKQPIPAADASGNSVVIVV